MMFGSSLKPPSFPSEGSSLMRPIYNGHLISLSTALCCFVEMSGGAPIFAAFSTTTALIGRALPFKLLAPPRSPLDRSDGPCARSLIGAMRVELPPVRSKRDPPPIELRSLTLFASEFLF